MSIIKPITPILITDLGMKYPTVTSNKKRRYGMYQCNCGTLFKAQHTNIKNGNTNSCGCYQIQKLTIIKTTHGLSHHPLYDIWVGMIQRCTNVKYDNYKNYGARGITVCDRWLDVSNFIEDMYPSYLEGLSLDRIDNNGNYELFNCRWATPSVQAQNTRKLRSTNTSGYRGVSLDKKTFKYSSEIQVNNVRHKLGIYTTALEAAIAYDTYVITNNLKHNINKV